MTSRQHTSVRIDNETLARIEAVREHLSTEWRDATTSDVLRALIYMGLRVMEKKYMGKAQKNPRKLASQRISRPTK